MTKSIKNQSVDWTALIKQLGEEFSCLSQQEQVWLEDRASAIGHLQRELDELFTEAGGLQACADCDGECCGCGRHHLTLINILAYLLEAEVPPAPDFERTCPFLGEEGCMLPIARRPYNCITFFCEVLEDRLDNERQKKLRSLDRKLRAEYESVERRYPVATLRGIWIGLERVSGRALLQRRDEEVVQ
jgi:hypothetical protein